MIERKRVRVLSDRPERNGDYVLYWMQASQREPFNPALEFAIRTARRLQLPVVVGFGLMPAYPEANARHYAFMLEGLKETKRAIERRGMRFVICRGVPDAVALRLARRAAHVVCDCGYLRHQRAWRDRVAKEARCRVTEIEGDVVVPVKLVSNKHEFAARTLRPKIMKLRDEFLRPLRRERVRPRTYGFRLESNVDLSDVPALVRSLKIDQSVCPVRRLRGGTGEARRQLRQFLRNKIDDYDELRSEPGAEAVSLLGAYLHFGQISPVEIALAARRAGGRGLSSYLEELVVRRELSMNFVAFEPSYDCYGGVPEWARKTLQFHRRDPRPRRYSRSRLERAETDDPYWNGAMREMTVTGYMHNHMRMYWGKKILEWSASPEEAFETALYFNNKYFLCGRDPNSYANVGWIFGLHDRPWPEREVFGKVRSMTASGLERKANMERYLSLVERLIAEEERQF
ncbi:MAG: deoxyribodipyrimidine photolyase [Rhodospirillales bacterium]|nr:deoxyribodipyrimidine photolyase [Rhodospirillales bacterium]